MKCSYKTASQVLVQLLDRVPPLRSRGMPAVDATHTAGGGCPRELGGRSLRRQISY